MIEVAQGYVIDTDTAELHGWRDSQLVLLQRIGRGIEHCRTTEPGDPARDLLCVLMLTYEERFGKLPQPMHERVERELCSKAEAVPA